MSNNTIREAIANIASTSEALEKCSNQNENYNSPGSELLERFAWELHKMANDLEALDHYYGL